MLNPPYAGSSLSLLEPAELEDLLNYLQKNQHIDLRGYKRPTLMRRILVRMQQVGDEHYQNYLDRLEQQSDESSRLLDTIFINHTYFFRDRFVWHYLAHQVIPQIIADKAPGEPIRVWSAGCASGEEIYSLAMLFAEALGIEQFQQRVQLYATDVDQETVTQARQGCYSAQAVATIPITLREQYFEQKPIGYCWRSDLRRSIVFLCRDLLQTPPLPQIDLLVCRNTLIYFKQEAQIRALVRFHFGLKDDGFLLLGQAEGLTHPQASLFTSVDQQAKVFTKKPGAQRDARLLSIAFSQKGDR